MRAAFTGEVTIGIPRGQQRKVCENILENNKVGPAVGAFGKDYLDPAVSCDAPTATEAGRAAAKVAAQKESDEDKAPKSTAVESPSKSIPKATESSSALKQASIGRVEEKLRQMGYTVWEDIKLKDSDRYLEVNSARHKDGKKFDLRLRVDTLAVVRIEDD
jgi:hypothetical protein